MPEQFTIFGANGFIGRAMVGHLRSLGHEVLECTRNNWPAKNTDLGHVIYAAGMTSHYAKAPFETVRSQTTLPAQILEEYKYSSFLYLSSTRFYAGAAASDEHAKFEISPTDPNDIYTLTKTTAECLCLSHPSKNVRVVRLSNVYGQFTKNIVSLASILDEAARTGSVEFLSSPQSAKDYISLNDVVSILPKIALRGVERIYNVAKGANTSNEEIANVLEQEGVRITFRQNAPTLVSPQINVERLTTEFEGAKSELLKELPALLDFARQKR